MKNFYSKLASGVSILAIAGVAISSPAQAETANASANTSNSAVEIAQVQEVMDASNGLAQNVTSVSQLSDVKPTDWAFTALQSLVERYGCIAGYPDRTYRGQRPMTRYEFAAGLNACLDKINEIISSGLADKVSKEDLAALQKLQEEFAAELAALRGRVDALEAKTAQLEAQQFSTTTKLAGQAIFAITGGSGGGDPFFSSNTNGSGDGTTAGIFSGGDGSSNVTFNSRVRLDLNTSFTGSDLLITRLEAGNGGTSTMGLLGVAPPGNVGNLGFAASGLDYAGPGTNFVLGKLRYDFNLFSPDLKVSVGPVMHVYDHIDFNSYANNEAVDFSSTFFINNPLMVLINTQTGGAGGAFAWNPNKGAFTLRGLYLAANASSPNPGEIVAGSPINRGLSGDPYQASVELEFAPVDKDGNKPLAIRLQYTNGSINNLEVNTGGVNVEWAFTKGFAIFGRYGFGSINSRNGVALNANPSLTGFVNTNAGGTNLNPQTYQVGLAFPDLFKSGALAAIAVGSPFIENQVGNSTQTNLEMFYNFPLTDNIRITPDLQFIFNPNNNSANGTITVGTLRTVFSF